VFLLLQSCLGLRIDGPKGQVHFVNPCLPTSLDELQIHNLEVAGGMVDLLLVRHEQDVNVKVLRNQGGVEVAVNRL
jgi:hypothetical protein